MRVDKRPPTAEECRQIFSACGVERDPGTARAVVMLLWRGGLRSQEVVDARWEHFESRGSGFVLHVRGKGDKRRTVGFDAKSMRNIKPAGATGGGGRRRSGPIIMTRTGLPWARTRVGKLMLRLSQRANTVIEFSPHLFRHAFARDLVEEGAQLNLVQDALGHSRISTTAIYLKLHGAAPSVQFGIERRW